MNIYRENILEHFRHPQNYGQLAKPDYSFYDLNTLCGDELTIDLKFKNKILSDIKFRGRGCAISQAAASLLSEKIKGLTKKQILTLDHKDILKLLKVDLTPARLKCATLALNIIKNGLSKTN